MGGRSAGSLMVGFTLLCTFILLGSLTSASSDLSRMGTRTTASRTASSGSVTGLHELTFIQGDLWGGHYTLGWAPWSVTLWNGAAGTFTESNPSNTAILPWPDERTNPSTNQSLSTITFFVPYGVYSYEIVASSVPAPAVFGQVDFSPSNPLPVGVGPWFPHPFMP